MKDYEGLGLLALLTDINGMMLTTDYRARTSRQLGGDDHGRM